MDEATATLIAACIAALVSLLTFLLTLIFNRKSEIRVARRTALEDFIFDLAFSIHQLIASSNILLKNKTEESRSNWNQKAEEAKKVLKDLRPKIRYALWGLDEPLKVLTRLPDYTNYTLESEKISKKVFKRGAKLGDSLDNCIRKCYLHGRAPKKIEIWYLRYLAWRFEKTRNDYKNSKKTRGNGEQSLN